MIRGSSAAADSAVERGVARGDRRFDGSSRGADRRYLRVAPQTTAEATAQATHQAPPRKMSRGRAALERMRALKAEHEARRALAQIALPLPASPTPIAEPVRVAAPRPEPIRRPPQRRSKHLGVTAVPGGGFKIRATAIDPRTGKLVDRRVFRRCTEDEAVKEFLRLKDEIRGAQMDRAGVKFDDYAKDWFERRKPRLESLLTRERYEQAIRLRLKPAFGAWYVEKIRRADVETWLAKALEAGHAAETINGWLRILKSIMTDAATDLELGREATRGVKPLPIPPRKKPNRLTVEQLPLFLSKMAVLYPQWYAFTFLGFGIGARPGELRPLRWDIDLEASGRLVLQQSQCRKYLGPTKTKLPREVWLPPELMEILAQHRRALIAEQRGAAAGLIFPSAETGSFISPSALDKPFRAVCRALGIDPPVTPKAMRRTFNDLTRQAGVDGMIIQAVTGHQDEKMRAKYSTVLASETRRAIGKVIEFAKPAAKSTP